MGDENKLSLNPSKPQPETQPENPPENPPAAETKATKKAGEIYVISGVQKLDFGRFTFEDSMLVLTNDEDVKEFEAMLEEHGKIRSGGYAARIQKVDASDDSLAMMKEKIVAAAVSGSESTEARARSLPQV